MKITFLKASIVVILTIIAISTHAQKGNISGKIVDPKTGEFLIGVAAMVQNSNPPIGAVTDIDGNFLIKNIDAGTYNLVFKYLGYASKTIKGVKVNAGQVTTLNISLEEENANLKEVEVVAEARRETQSAIFIMQKNSTVIQSGISSEDIKRSPDRSSSDVLRRVSGATIQDGKFAVIRGLADRYNMALLNTTLLPSTEPDRKAFAFDVFPSNVLDNIIIMKTGQPDLPSEWAGGLIQLNTRDIPDKNFFNITYGISFTEQTTFKPYINYEGSKTDFLGLDNSRRVLGKNFPSVLDFQFATSDSNRQKLGRDLIERNSWKTRVNRMAYPGQSLQLSGGFSVKKKELTFGGVAALTYSNTLRFTDGTRSRIDVDGSPYLEFIDKTHNNSVTTAALANLSVVFKNKHRLSWKNIYTINSDDNTVLRSGVNYFSSVEVQRTNLEFISSRVFSSNLLGDHAFGKNDMKFRWNFGAVLVHRDQPNTRRYSFERLYEADSLGAPNTNTQPFGINLLTGFSVDPKLGAMFYSTMSERVLNGGLEYTVPFRIQGAKQNVRVGGFIQDRRRAFDARNFFAKRVGSLSDSIRVLSIDQIVNAANIEKGLLTFTQTAFPNDKYQARSNTYAGYAMMENHAGKWFKAVWGFRFEYFHQDLTTSKVVVKSIITPEGNLVQTGNYVDTVYTKKYFSGAYQADSTGRVTTKFPLLPSVNLVFKLNESMNFRASYSQSMSRPEFRECAPFRYYDFITEYELLGNENLLQTFIHNADVRYEWFLGKGQAINTSVFYKRFQNTIEFTALSSGGVDVYAYSNAVQANLVGAELEIRKNFGFAHPRLEDLVFTANLAYIYSRVDLTNVKNIANDELKRPMQGQSPYIINLGLGYQHPKYGFGATLLYNQAGDRLSITGIVGNPAWYEHFRPLLDLQLSQKFWKDRGIIRLTFSDLIAKPTIFYQNVLTAKDIDEINKADDKVAKAQQLNDKNRHYQKGQDYIVRSFQNYRTYSIQIGFTF
jgi:hypothetical protein